MLMSNLRTLLRNLGPGLLFAGMAIGTSHLVLSTKAGAQYGWIMAVPIVLANVLKYPFFEFGVRYTNVTDRTLIEGYRRLGKKYLWFYASITVFSTFSILAALYTVTAGLLINILKIDVLSVSLAALMLFIFISSILIIGRYRVLENTLKFIVAILFVALLVTTALVVMKGPVPQVTDFIAPPIFDQAGVLFLIGLMGWMPTTVEASSWVSLWSVEKWRTQGLKPGLSEALREFNVGYFVTALLALFFLAIGCLTLYGTNTVLSNNAVAFADQVVGLFTSHIGQWAYIFIAVSAFATMFSTSMSAHDATARVSLDIISLLRHTRYTGSSKWSYAITVLVLAVVNFFVLWAFAANMGQLVSLATFVSFVVAPFIGYMNLRTVTGSDVPPESRPKKGLRWLTYAGIGFLFCFSVLYLWMVILG